MTEILEFLKELDLNNNREWFDANRSRYEKTRAKFLDFTANLISKIREYDDEISLLNPKDCMFRIFRDVRFSNDKRPFKNNYGSYIARGGRKAGFSGYYFHVQPSEMFLSGGIYMPPPEHLQAIRQEIYYRPEVFKTLIENEEFKRTFTEEYSDKLKTAPKGFPKDWEHIELLKNRSYAYGKPLTEKELVSQTLLEDTIRSFKIIFPVNRFLNKSIDENLIS
jgi:uncharacterized protein (TIGR02453 family)